MAAPPPDETAVIEPPIDSPTPEGVPAVPLTRVIPSGEGFRAVLRNRYFLAIWSAQVTSQTAQNAVWYCLIILIANLTGANALSVGGIIIMVQLPTVLFSSLSGVMVDRLPKKTILIATNYIRAIAVVGYLFLTGYGEFLYLITFVVAVVSQPFQPAEGATIPLIVSEEQLITANSLFQATFMASQIAGFGLAAVLLSVVSQSVTFLVLIGLFAYAGTILLILPPVTAKGTAVAAAGIVDTADKVWHDLIEGGRSIWADKKLLAALIQITFAPTFLLLLAQVAPDFLKSVLHVHKTSLIFLMLAPAGLGMGIGLFILGHWGNRIRKDRLVVVALLALSVSVLGFSDVPSLSHELWLPFSVVGINPGISLARVLTMIPVSLLIGIEIAFINAPLQTIVQERAPVDLRGRILAMQQTLTAAVAIPPLLLIGGVAFAVGIQGSLALVGVALFVVALASVYAI